jgi:hypothetical protein
MEGEGFNATLCRDGKKIAFVIDDATGGDVQIQWANAGSQGAEEKRLMEFLKKLPAEQSEGIEYSVDPGIFVAALVDENATEKRLRRIFRKQTLFRLKEDRTDDDKWRVLKAPFSPGVKAQLVKRYGDRLGQVLNEQYPHLTPKP